jgi:hypothetical protein
MKLKDIETALPLAQRLLSLRAVKKRINDLASPASFEIQLRVIVSGISETVASTIPVEEKVLVIAFLNREIQELENALAALGVEV